MSLYTTAFGLTHPPFQRALAADQLFRPPALDELHSRLRYLVDSQALGLLTGESPAAASPPPCGGSATTSTQTRSAPSIFTTPW